MPGNTNNGFDAGRFAAIWAGCDAGNSDEVEAVAKFRAVRRMVMAANLRIVDAMGRTDVMLALDAQLEPVREESPELKTAFLQVAQLAELANERQEMIDQLRQELARISSVRTTSRFTPTPARTTGDALVNGGLVAAVSIVAVILILAALFQTFQ